MARKPTRADRVLAFIDRYVRVPEGKLVGQPIKLAKFQRKFIRDVFDNPKGTRRAYLSIGRKNGKSALIAAILLAYIVGPEKQLNAQIISGGRSRDQAALVFKLASKMCMLHPALAQLVRIIPSSKTIIGLVANVEYRAISAEAGTAHGLSPLLAILDEVGQVRGPHDDFVEAITTAQGAHESPLLIAISTQAASDADLLSVWLDDAARNPNPTVVSHVYAAPPDCDLMDKKAWRAANPALGLFRSEEDVRQQAMAAKSMPTAENGFRNLTLNQRVTRFTPLIAPSVWKACNGQPDDRAFTEGEVYGGLDLSMTTDLTALVLIARYQERWHVRSYFWTPGETLEERERRDKAPYALWVRQGHLRTTPGKVVKYDHVAAEIEQICHGLDVRKIAFDRYRMAMLKSELDKIDCTLPFESFGQGYVSMAPAIDALEIAFLQGDVRHGGHPVLSMCAATAIVTKDPAGNRKLDKSKSTGRIDGVVALTMAMGVATGEQTSAVPLSPWDADPNFTLAGS